MTSGSQASHLGCTILGPTVGWDPAQEKNCSADPVRDPVRDRDAPFNAQNPIRCARLLRCTLHLLMRKPLQEKSFSICKA